MKDLRKISFGINAPENLEKNTIYVDVHFRNGFFFARAYSNEEFNYQKNFGNASFEEGKSKRVSTKPLKHLYWGNEWNGFVKYLIKGNRAKLGKDHLTQKEKDSYQEMIKTW